MAPATHGLVSWWVANVIPLSRRDRLLVFLVGLCPDLDGLGLLGGLVGNMELYFHWHHIVCHNLLFGLLATGLAALLAVQRAAVVGLALIAFHLHLACDYFGSGGWDGPQLQIWALPYLYPFLGCWRGATFTGPSWYWNPWQWSLSSPVNAIVTILGLVNWVFIAVRLDRTWFEFVAPRFDLQFCGTLRKWFGGTIEKEWSEREGRLLRQGLALVCVLVIWACVLGGLQAEVKSWEVIGGGLRAVAAPGG